MAGWFCQLKRGGFSTLEGSRPKKFRVRIAQAKTTTQILPHKRAALRDAYSI
jgi:hypothetical protein